jgi:acyl transferase domain-containing protein
MSGANGGSDDQIPVAIVGMSCRLSGVATSPEGLWQMLSKGLTGWSNNGSNRFQMDAFWHPQGDLGGSVRKLFSRHLSRSC